MTLKEAIETEAERTHMFAELAQLSQERYCALRLAGDARAAGRWSHRSHVAYLAMLRLERAS